MSETTAPYEADPIQPAVAPQEPGHNAATVAPGWLKFMPDLVRQLWDHGVRFSMNTTTGTIDVDGFYHHGPMSLEITPSGSLQAIDRKGVRTGITSYEDLARLNYDWWLQTTRNNRRDRYIIPGAPWLDTFVALRLAQRKIIVVPRDAEHDDSN
jgi:hypothetical protein